MTREKAVELIRRVVAEIVGEDISAIDTSKDLAADYGFDSLDVVEFVKELEALFDIDISPSDFLTAPTIDRMADVVVNKTMKNLAHSR